MLGVVNHYLYLVLFAHNPILEEDKYMCIKTTKKIVWLVYLKVQVLII